MDENTVNEISLNLSDEVIHNILDAQTKEQTPEKLLPPSHFVCPVWKVKLFKGTSFIILSTF